ncbi:MAG: hypothetical protein LQ338_003405 [Usnochroma carphineum]|nr:MAG: hypothetical protein LQ338_003405 [Usnochroma carphineum]
MKDSALLLIFNAFVVIAAVRPRLPVELIDDRNVPSISDQPTKRSGLIYPRITYNRECNATGFGKFACVTCDDPTVKNEIASPADRWAAADGDNAWTQVTSWWSVLRDSGSNPLGSITGFVPSISWYWQGPEQWDCADIGESFCNSVVKCSDADIPAASMTLTAFANIHIFYDNFYTAIHDAEGAMLSQISGFSKIFAPQGPDTLQILKLILDAFGMSYGLIGAGVWNKILKDAPIFKNRGNDHGWAKDSANSAVSTSTTLAKDAAPGIKGEMDTQNDLSRELGTLVDGWANVTSTYVKNLFSGTDDGITQLGAYINGGAWYNTDMETSLFSLQGIMENVLYGQMIPKAWGDHAAVNPVVVFQSESNVGNPLTTILQGDASRTLSDSVRNPIVQDGKSLIDLLQDATKAKSNYGGTTLWLLDAHDCGAEEPLARGGSGSCDTSFVQLLPGEDQLDGKQWGGVLVDDINISAFVGYQLNGNKNGYEIPDNSRFTDMNENADYPYQAGIRTPGFFSIPVCDINTVFDVTVRNKGNEGHKNRCPTYPCC